jgi:multidrug efflux system membrane fusion protein
MCRWTSSGYALIMAALMSGCGAGENDKKAASLPPPEVTVSQVVGRKVTDFGEFTGRTDSPETVEVRARVNGYLTEIHFTDGQEVKQGDRLFQIDPRPFSAALAAAKANLARDIATAKNARQQAEFQADIFKRSAGTQRELDQALAMAEAAEAQVDADKAAIQTAQVQLDYCTICSPLDGRTGDLMVHEGGVVKNDDTSLITINQVAPIYVSFAVAEKYLPQIRRYLKASEKPLAVDVTFPQDVPGDEGPAQRGDLTFVDNQVDKTTGMIQLKGTFANEDRTLWPGQFVNVALVLTSLANAVVVPTQAVQTSQQGRFIFVVRPDNTVESRPVTTGVIWGDLTVIEKGVAANDRVVTDGQLRLAPGTKVSIKNATASEPIAGTTAKMDR